MSDTSPVLSLPFIQPSQAQKHVTHNEALRFLDVAVQAVVLNRDQSAPPPAPVSGDRHIVATGGSGDWAGHDGEIALFDGAAWQFLAAQAGWQVQVLAEDRAVVFDGTGWAGQVPDLNNLDGVGIGTGSDATNRLAVAADATLLTHAGDGHQLKIDKAQGSDTASLLFQTGWSGRAEMGTAGSDDFTIKVSADGAAWTTALQVDAASGAIGLDAGTAAAPALGFGGDAGTGLFRAGADELGIAVAGAEALRVDSTGKLGIATATPTKPLDVNGEAIIRGTVTVSYANGGAITMADTTNGGYAQIGSYDGRLIFRADQGNTESNTNISFLIDTAEVARFGTDGALGLGTSSPTEALDVNSDAVRLRGSRTPASASASGSAGTICWDADYIYVCTATNTWKRAALASW